MSARDGARARGGARIPSSHAPRPRARRLSANPKLSETKKAEFQRKLNVLRSFKPTGGAGRGEL